MPDITIGIIFTCILFILMFLGFPIAFCMAITGFAGLTLIRGLEPAFYLIGSTPYIWTTSTSFLPLPLFILMGQIVFYTGIGEDLFDVAYKWIGRSPGGLIQAVILSCTGFAACTGESFASSAIMGKIAYPLEMKLGYNRSLAAASIAVGGTIGILIPPSLPFIIYGVLTKTSVADLFAAGILPGLLLSICLLLLVFIMVKRNPKLAPLGPPVPWRDKLVALPRIISPLVLFCMVLGGLYTGVFAPSEAGAAGAFGALLIGLAKRKITLSNFLEALKSAVQVICFIFTIIIGAMIFNIFLAESGLAPLLTDWLTNLSVSAYGILAAVLCVYLVLGCLMDTAAMCLLTIPTFVPILTNIGFDAIHFGVLFVVMAEVALITPPLGINCFVVQGVIKIPLYEIFKGVLPFIIVMLLVVIILIIFPQISLFLPSIL